MEKTKKLNTLYEYALIIVGAIIIALAFNIFFTPNKLIVGGITGLAIVIDTYIYQIFNIDFELSIINILLNTPFLIIAYFILGKSAIIRTAFTTLLFSVALSATKNVPSFSGDMMLVALYGGILNGCGCGLIFKGMSSTGGVDTIASIIHKLNHNIAISKIMLSIDSVIIIVGLMTFGHEKTMYAIISVFVCSKCISGIIEGTSFARAVYIISDKSTEISIGIMKETKKGVTAFKAKGMYTGNDKEVILCVLTQKEITKIKAIVKNIDQNAFIMISDVKEALGAGFNPFI